MAHVLIVDDEPSIGWGLAPLAESLGHTAAMAASAEQGLAAAVLHQLDAIVLNVRLPGMDSLEAMGYRNRLRRQLLPDGLARQRLRHSIPSGKEPGGRAAFSEKLCRDPRSIT